MPGISSICPRCGWRMRHSCPHCRYPGADQRTEIEKKKDEERKEGEKRNIRYIYK
ncbi:MAG: hypothetical protein U5L76_02835 [Patescibacteria group bacterium]|nr:hypothetical protein [Patescibacteria group bacterium]